jgi:formylglycine-generating enzyme required for sulfatase activity/serine/threonine protein kinase
MSDTPQNTRRDGAAGPSGTGLSQSGDLSGISEMFWLRDGQQAESGTRTGTDTVGRWVAATEGADQPPDISSRLVHGRYRLIAELGVGGMGVTYRAWDTQAGIPVVVKMPRREVRQDSEAMQRFAREIDAMLAVPQDNIVPITDHGDDDGCPFVVMRFLPGGSLADYRRRDEAGNAIRNPPGMLHFWLPGVAAALDHIHAKGMLHRDVKPGNIFLDGFLKPYLGDFGIAKAVDESGGLQKEQTLTATKMAVGTPEYMAPELFKPRSKPDGRVDQYALAVTVYEMLSGEKPFKGDRAHIIVEHSGLPVPPLAAKVPGLPPRLCMAVERGLAKKTEERFATCSDFAAAVLSEVATLPPESDTVRLLCPSCKNILKLPQKAAGKTGKCPRCQAAMDVAADLGSLWLESEERGAGGGGKLQAGASPETPFAEVAVDKPQRRWGLTEWATMTLAACVGLGVGYPVGNSRQRPQTIIISPAGDYASAIKERDSLTVERNTLRDERDALAADYDVLRGEADSLTAANLKLTADVTAANAAEIQALSDHAALAMRVQALDAELMAARAVKTSLPEGVPPQAPSETSPPAPVVPSVVKTLVNSVGMRFVLCQSGTFTMGDDASGYPQEQPAHSVTISKPFYISIYEVRNVQWRRVMGEVPSEWTNDELPVANVNCDDIKDFCQRLAAISAEEKAGRTYRLPTEAEWEYACRAGSTTRFSFGDDDSQFDKFAQLLSHPGIWLQPVGQKRPNAWGLYDVHGNAAEWCSDWYDGSYYTNSPEVDPQGPSSSTGHVVFRSCSNGNFGSPGSKRSASRGSARPSDRAPHLGFRPVLILSGSNTREARGE